jgi:hypothetical protein
LPVLSQTFFPGIGITNTTSLRPIFGSLFVFWNLFQKKNSIVYVHYLRSPLKPSLEHSHMAYFWWNVFPSFAFHFYSTVLFQGDFKCAIWLQCYYVTAIPEFVTLK